MELQRSDRDELGFVGSLVESRIWPADIDRLKEMRVKLVKLRSGAPGEASDRRLRELAENQANKLAGILRSANPLFILGRFAECAEFQGGDFRDWYETHGVHALVQYAVGLSFATSGNIDLSAVPSDGDVQEAFDLVAEIFLIEWELITHTIGTNQPEYAARVQGAFKVEALTDRWQGYTVHLKDILAATLGPIRDDITRELGWYPAIIPELGVGLARVFQRRMDEFRPGFRADLMRAKPSGRAVYGEEMSLLLERHKNFAADLFVVDAPALSAEIGLSVDTLEAALRDLSWNPGQQPEFLLPAQDNLARTYSGVKLEGGKYFLWMPSALIQESHAWFYDLLQRRSLESIKKRYLAARDTTTEKIASSTLQRLFGKDRVFRSAQYDAPGRPDVDCLVVLPGDAILVECKAHLLTAAGRRGAPGRLATKFEELVVKPSFQADRAARHILSGKPVFTSGRKVIPVTANEASLLPRVVITYERVDPFSTYRGARPEVEQPAPSWIIPLADLMVIADLIQSPAAFWYYVSHRYRQSQDPRLVVFNEIDLLELFLVDLPRFESLTSPSLSADERVLIGPCGYSINNYYASMAPDAARRRPGLPLPAEVLSALDRNLAVGDPAWRFIVEAVLAEPSKTWTKFKNLKAKVVKRGTDHPIRLDTVQGSLNITMTKSRDSLVIDIGAN
ncbi:hypothetical protein FHR83_006377 [Actinoplanes campanulatus]|uniref:Nuclease-related domain-containing protein n=1 Tax=Actinoplanes campanulatus TaxID=113559 RepID=A0A7W5FHH5_9ACTN|nr:hypothetical protein [Actinoplanes campanulatus]MBB3098678.1 hypothetical protein [Actinoplanes campanulatus]GGN37589.1 hypothetical protein GCM10010109_63710 [Actinoplanes campanulatus]GID40822.1 hypothetical protein Aca09nite_73280 [Actinoplanes campanulatus]